LKKRNYDEDIKVEISSFRKAVKSDKPDIILFDIYWDVVDKIIVKTPFWSYFQLEAEKMMKKKGRAKLIERINEQISIGDSWLPNYFI